MLIIPAIDLIQGKCVRLVEGDYGTKKEYSADPLDVAFKFKEAGARRIHIVDLDGAKSGTSINRDVIKQIKIKTNLIVETGGGIRTESDIKELIDAGIDYLILGTVLVENIDMVIEWIKKYSDKLIAGIDVKNNVVKTRGWLEGEGIDAVEFGKKLFGLGFSQAVYTDISKDGRLEGVNIAATRDFAVKTNLNVILSGGVSNADDIKNIKMLNEKRIIGAIVGKAYYEGRINLKEVIKKYQN